MGMLVDGKWQDTWYDTKKSGGKFVRHDSTFRNWVSRDGSTGFKAEADRYHLYVAHACPWAHRALIFRKLKKLDTIIDVSVVHPLMLENGWTFQPGDGCTGDKLHNSEYLYQVYLKAKPDYTGRVTVPILWDKKTGTIVSNESADVIRMFNSAFADFTDNHDDYYPDHLRGEIDEVNAFVYDNVNNGVYKSGFATTQDAYDSAVTSLFNALDQLEQRLQGHTYLVGETLTEADLRLLPTLLRFDSVYVGHFKCNKRRIRDYPNLHRHTQQLFALPGIADTYNLAYTKLHYYGSHESVNPTRIVPAGPDDVFGQR